MSALRDLDALTLADLKALVPPLLAELRALSDVVAAQREEIARLKGLKGPPSIKPPVKPSGMEAATKPKPAGGGGRGRGRGRQRIAVTTIEDRVVRPVAIRFQRERWQTPDGRTIVAPLPVGIEGHFGPAMAIT